MDPLTWAFLILWGSWTALTSIEAETWLRLAAAVALVWHPIHEQRLGFRFKFNRAVNGKYEGKSVRRMGEFVLKPLSRRMNALQALALATVFPALALCGPWWALWGLLSFYVFDYAYTHVDKKVPAGWSAGVGMLACLVAAIMAMAGNPTSPLRGALLVIGSVVAGALILATPWWMAFRKVRAS